MGTDNPSVRWGEQVQVTRGILHLLSCAGLLCLQGLLWQPVQHHPCLAQAGRGSHTNISHSSFTALQPLSCYSIVLCHSLVVSSRCPSQQASSPWPLAALLCNPSSPAPLPASVMVWKHSGQSANSPGMFPCLWMGHTGTPGNDLL